MKILAKDTWQIAIQNWKHILLFELLYRGITFPVYLQLSGRGLHLALHLAGYSYLTAGNIGSFLVRPWSIVIFLVLGLVGMILLAVETAGLITAFQGSAYYQKLTPLHMFWSGIQMVAKELHRKNWRLGLMLLLQYLLINLVFIERMLTHMKPVNFLWSEMAKQPWTLVLAAFALAVCVMVSVPALFVCYGCMIEQKSYHDSLHRSRRMLKGHVGPVLGLLLGYNLLAALAALVVYLAAVCAAAVFIVLFTDQNLAMAVLLLTADRLELGLLFTGSILAVVGNGAALSVAYYRYGNQRFHGEGWDFRYPAKGNAGRRQVAGVLCMIVALSLFYIYDLVRHGSVVSDELLIQTEITAHRGSSRTAPENTMAAMLAAIDDLADSEIGRASCRERV